MRFPDRDSGEVVLVAREHLDAIEAGEEEEDVMDDAPPSHLGALTIAALVLDHPERFLRLPVVRNGAFREVAIGFCRDNHIPYEDGL